MVDRILSTVLSYPMLAWAQSGPIHDMGYGMSHWMHGWWPLGPIIMLVVLAVFIVGLVTVVKWLFGIGGGSDNGST